ncbi:MAG: DUF4838 domain-containing protein [Lentisphaerae bacterium]|nr:DUF4838 domain-containing protein [Lentisphaerota bacterium]
MNDKMFCRILVILCAAWAACASGVAAETWIVQDGQARAQIVTAAEPPRLVKLAAEELRDYLRKITGAELPIMHDRSTEYPVAIYIGQSAGTDALGITDEGLKYGAYRIVSGPDYLVLLGHDADFTPSEPWARNHGDRDRAQREWEELTGGDWRNPMTSLFRSWHKSSGIWTQDEGGSLQAVYAFLRDQGVRWYMPGPLGEVVPRRESLPLPSVDKTVHPDFAYRDLRLGNVPGFPWEDFVHHLRLGLNDQGLAGSHGMRLITSGAEMKANHPEYYALVRGQRNTKGRGAGHACFSSPGLLQESINFARAVFDVFGSDAVSIFPEDGYNHCGCELCAGKTPSELVWTFVNNVAKAVYETHPEHYILGGAYTSYREPPESIEKFNSNVVVRISWMRPGLDDDARWAEYWETVQAWAPRLAPGRLMRNANIQWTASTGFPIIHTRSIARELSAMRGIVLGEASSVPRNPQQRWEHPGLSHLNIYVLSSYLWDAQQDLDVLLDEYYTLFYGPAQAEMRAAFEFAEAIYPREGRPTPSRVSYADRVRFVELLHQARAAAGDTVYGERVQMIIDELQPLEKLRELQGMSEARGDVKEFPVMHNMAGNSKWQAAAQSFKLDGQLDELLWTAYHHGGGLADNLTGKRPQHATRFYLKWYEDALYIGIRCDDPDAGNLNITATAKQDAAIHDGDCVTLLLETQDLSYYEITINPAGAVWDADHSEGGVGEAWSSQAEVATFIGDGYWNVEARIPVRVVSPGTSMSAATGRVKMVRKSRPGCRRRVKTSATN